VQFIINFYNFIKKLSFLISKKNQKKSIKILIGMVIVALAEVLGLGLIYPTIQQVLGNKIDFLNEFNFYKNLNGSEQLLLVLIVIFFVFLFKNIFTILFIIYRSTFMQNFLTNLRKKLYKLYVNQNFKSFVDKNSPDILRNIQIETTVVMRSLEGLINILSETLILLGILTLLIFLAPLPSTIIILLCFLFFLIYVLTFKKKIFKLGKERFELDSSLISHVNSSLGNYKEILIYNIFSFFNQKFDDTGSRLNKNMRNTMVLSQSLRVIIEQFGIIIILGLSFYFYNKSENFSSNTALLGAYVYAFFKILPSLGKITLNLQAIINGNHSVEYLCDEIQRLENLQNPNINKKIENLEKFHHLKIQDLDFKIGDKYILKNINLEINSNDKIGIMGESGSGKTTLLNLIMGLVEPYRGKIILNGSSNLKNLNHNIAFVSQSNHIMNDTLKNNVTFGQYKNNEIDEKKFWNSIRKSGLEKFIMSLKNKENTIINEDATNISGGESQRILIARALYFASDIIILDEFSSALDIQTENKILEEINQIDKTIIIVSHRKNTFKNLKKIYQIDNKSLNKIDV
jgi:ABC-type multidrug transport system fused ATPase/permease subunit